MTELIELDFKKLIESRIKYSEEINPIIITDKYLDFVVDINIFKEGIPRSGFKIVDLFFQNCGFLNDILIRDFYNSHNVTFENCNFQGETNFLDSRNVSLNGINIFKTLSITAGVNQSSTALQDIQCLEKLKVFGNEITLENININVESETSCVLEIQNNSQKARNTLKNVRFHKIVGIGLTEVTVLEGAKIGEIHIGGSIAKNRTVQLLNTQVNRLMVFKVEIWDGVLDIRRNSRVDRLSIEWGSFQQISILNSSIGTLSVKGTLPPANILSLIDVDIEAILFYDVQNKGEIFFNGVNFASDINKTDKYGNQGKLSLDSSILGITNFINCNFSQVLLEFYNSKITDIFVAQSDFPKTVFNDQGLPDFIQAQLFFGQLSTAYQKQGDTVRALEYQAREIEAHEKNLKWFNDDAFFTKLSLVLNKISNDFGRNWVRAIIFTLVLVGIPGYYLLIVSSKEYTLGWGFSYNPKLIGSFFRFMNPLRFYETEKLFISNSDNNPYLHLGGWSYFWDFLSRILVSYGYYQTIQAFRRYGRK